MIKEFVKRAKYVAPPCVNNPACDIDETRSDMVIDMADAMATGVVPSIPTDNPYTQDMQVSEIGHYLTDKIATALAIREVNASLASQAAKAQVKGEGPA